MKLSKIGLKIPTLCLSICAGMVFYTGIALGAEKVIMRASVFELSISLDELQNFAETGEVSASLRDVFRTAKVNRQIARQALTQPVPMNLLVLDRTLNSPLGEAWLDEMGKIVHTRVNQANREALRAALILSASKDNQISLLEVIENYPTSEVLVQADRLASAYQQLSRFGLSLPQLGSSSKESRSNFKF